jgi:two-component system, cell cycle sensor histidine kinase and response regulator CckA
MLVAAVGISGALAIIVLRYRPTVGSQSFAVLMGSVALWAFLNLFEVIAQDLPTKQFAGHLKYLFIVTVPVAWFIFALFYSNRIRRLRFAHLALLSTIPVLTLVMTATNGFHHLMFQSVEWRRVHDITIPVRQFGPWFWVHTAYCYALLFLGFLFLARTCVDSQRIYRRQAISLLVAAMAPWLCNIFFLSGSHALPDLDLTPFAFTVSGLAIMWGILRYRLLDVGPIARDIVIQNMSDGILVMDKYHRILDVNPAAAELAGGQQATLIGRYVDQVIPWWPKPPVIKDLNETGFPTVIEIEHEGRSRHLQMSASVLRNKDKPLGHLFILHDITEIRTTQEAMRRSEDRFKAISENAPVIILSTDESGTITYVNPFWQTILGHDRNEVIGRPFNRFIAEEPVGSTIDFFDHLMKGSARMAEGHLKFRHKNDCLRMFNFTASINSDGEGRITGIVCVARDVTEEERLKAQLFQSQKMEAIGTLAGGVAHDFNNLLMGMQANVSLLRLEFETHDAAQEKFKRIEDQIQCGASLTRQLLGYARKGKYVVAPIDIHQPIEEALKVIQRTNKSIRVQRLFGAAPSILEADQGQIELVLLNLFVNAADAMPKGGDLTVSTRLAEYRELVDQLPDLKHGRYIEIKVTDTGVGMDQGTLERIFEPFFTTKEIGRGTGLGLASVYGVVKNHYGHIQVSSRIGVGTTFTLLFHAAPQPAVPFGATQPDLAAATREGHILLVDDEPQILEYVGEMIQSLGFIVLPADNGEEAVRMFEHNRQIISLVVLDMYMPGMDGKEVFQRLYAIDPDVKVIVASGYGRTEASQSILEKGCHVMLTKPFTRDELAQAITQLLCREQRPRPGPMGDAPVEPLDP